MKTVLKSVVFSLAAVASTSLWASGTWTYDPSAKTITDTSGAQFKIESYKDVEGVRKLFVRYYNSVGDGILDFRQTITPSAPIDGISSIVIYGFGKDTVYGDNANVTELYLPDTTEYLNDYCFRGLTKAKIIEPFIPDSVIYEQNPFSNCYTFRGDLVLGGGGQPLTMSGGADAFKRSMITSITFGTGKMSIPYQHFYGCGNCTNITFLGDGNVSWNSCAFQAWNSYQALIKVPATSSWWANYMKTESSFTAWDKLGTYQSSYWTKFDPDRAGKAPLGAIKLGSNSSMQYITTFKIATTTKDLTVYGVPGELGTVSPTYGDHKDVGDAPVACQASASATADGIYYVCKGYVIETLGDTGWENAVTNLGVTSFNYTAAAAGQQRVTWLWEASGYAVRGDCTFVDGYDLGSVAASGTEVASGYFQAGASVSLTASAKDAAAAPFVRWCGTDVPEGHENDNPLVLTADRVKTVYPYFRTKWTLASNKMSDGYWKFNVSTSGKKVTLGTDQATTGNSTLWNGGYLDLAKGFADESYSLVGVCKDFCFGTYSDACAKFREMTFPETLTWLGEYSFRSCTNLKKITPFLPLSVTSVNAAFQCCSSLAQDWYIGGLSTNAVTVAGYLGGQYMAVPSVTFGYGVKSIAGQFFYGNSKLKTLKFMGDKPTFSNNSMLEGCSARSKRVFIPKGNATWNSVKESSSFNVWTNLSVAVQKEYTDAYPGEALPLGTVSFTGSTQWLCTWKPPKLQDHLMIFIR